MFSLIHCTIDIILLMHNCFKCILLFLIMNSCTKSSFLFFAIGNSFTISWNIPISILWNKDVISREHSNCMKVEVFSQKQKTSFCQFQTWLLPGLRKCLPQSFPTPNGVTVLVCPAILLGLVCFVFVGRCYCHCYLPNLAVVIAIFVNQGLADVIAI